MARMRVLALICLPFLALAGCSVFFGFNAYSGLDPAPTPNPASYTGLGGLAALSADLSSPAFVAALRADPAATLQISADLVSLHNLTGSITSVDQQQAAVLYCDIQLKTTAGEALINNVVSTIVGGIPASTTIQSLLTSILPPEALASQAAFTAMVNALLLSNDMYLLLGAGLVDVNLNGKIDPGESVAPGTNVGDIAQKAAVSYTMAVIYNQILGKVPAGQEIAQIYLLATAPTSALPAVQSLSPDPYNQASLDVYVSANLPKVKKIFDCAGMALPSST